MRQVPRVKALLLVRSIRWKELWNALLTHWGRVTHICVSKLTIIGADNGLLPGRRQAIIWTNAGILLIGPLGTNFSEILIAIETFSFKKKHMKISSAKWRLFHLGLNELTGWMLMPVALCWLTMILNVCGLSLPLVCPSPDLGLNISLLCWFAS